MNRYRKCWAGLATVVLLVAFPPFPAAAELKERPTPRRLEPAYAHLRAVADSSTDVVFNPARVDSLLRFILSDKEAGVRYQPGKADGATSAYHDFSVELPLGAFLRLCYNPALPSHITVPSTVRLSYWSSIEGDARPIPRLWRHLENLQIPYRVDGVERVVNTPDLHTGAYYAYDLDRTLILMRWEGKNVMLSLSKQRGRSDVGKKGAVLGDDDRWNYLYTEQEGLSRTGLGWVDSYMYDSFSVTAYVEMDADSPLLRCGIFKWLDAGWAGINVVRSSHIHRGLVRFGDAFKAVVESPQLADIGSLEQKMHRVVSLSDQALRLNTADYYRRLHRRHGADNRLLDKWFQNALGKDGHLARLNRRQMEARICIEVLKSLLGRDPEIEIGRLTAEF